mgnify:FL=1
MNKNTKSHGMSESKLSKINKHIKNNYINNNKYIGTSTLIYRQGEIAYLDIQGQQDRERSIPLKRDTIFRIYSMTKPITSVALMTLYEEGKFQLDDFVYKYIPSWKNLKSYQSGKYPNFKTKTLDNHMTIKDLLSHQSGLTYGFSQKTEVDKAYREKGIGRMESLHTNQTLEDMINLLSEVPLEFNPGSSWNYSVSTDVLGYLIELLSGMPFDTFLKEKIFKPLDMNDTGFYIPENKLNRFAANYIFNDGEKLGESMSLVNKDTKESGPPILIEDPMISPYSKNPTFFSGGGGLVSTIDDYLNFCIMLLNNGSYENHQILSKNTVNLMTNNHITGEKDLLETASGRWAETTYSGIGFGLGFQILLDPVKSQITSSKGEYGWGGAASTVFWIDPKEDLITIFLTQLVPSSAYNIRRELRTLVYSSINN